MSKLSELVDCLKPATDEHGSPVLQSEYDRLCALLDENERLRKALQEIERFGHNEGHGRGYTCADMAADALEQKT
jgi:hypothetical protein